MLRAAYPSWALLNRRLGDAIEPLSDADLRRAVGPGRWPLWAVVGHLACQRVFWLCDVAGERGADSTPFTNAAWSCPGDEDLVNFLDAPALTAALTSTFAIVDRVLDSWDTDSLDEVVGGQLGEEWSRTRGFIVERVFAHDCWHAAEANEILTALGRPPVDPWE